MPCKTSIPSKIGSSPPVATPYFCDLLTFLLCTRFPFRSHWLWVNLLILGLVSPLVNSGYEYLIGFLAAGSDVAQLLYELPPIAVHAYFAITLLVYILGFLAILILPSHTLLGRFAGLVYPQRRHVP